MAPSRVSKVGLPESLDSNEFVDDVYRPEEVLDYFDYTWFHFNVSEPNVGEGEFCEADQTLTVSPAVLEDGITIPHELIHLHEFVINDLPMYYHDMVYWALYKDLRNKIPDLDDIITGHAHLLTGSTIYGEGGTHDILFLLKSFNLDIRMGYPLGTIFAYGRADIFKSYSYNRD